MGKLSYNDKLCMQRLWQVSHCLVYTEWLSQCCRLTANFLNSAQLSPLVMVTGNDGLCTKSLLTKHLHVQLMVLRYTQLVPSLELHIGPACEAGLSAHI